MKLEQVMIIRPKIEPKTFDPENECEHCDDPMTCGSTGKYLTDPGFFREHGRAGVAYFAQFVVQLHRQETLLGRNGHRPTEVLIPLCAPGARHFTFHGVPVIKSGEVRTPTLQRSETYNHG
jgi:hypothetical protein